MQLPCVTDGTRGGESFPILCLDRTPEPMFERCKTGRWLEMNPGANSLIQFAALLWLAVVATLAAGAATAAVQPGPGKAWLVIASRSTEADAIALAQSYAPRFPTAAVFRSNNGFYAVTLGWAGRDEGAGLLQSLVAQGAIPGDAYFHNGERYAEAVWTANNSHYSSVSALISACYLFAGGAGGAPPVVGGQPQIQQPPSQQLGGQPGYVTGLDPNGDNYLSLRLGPGGSYREIARMRPDTELTLHAAQGGWLQVSLANGISGWASARYIARGQLPRSQAAVGGRFRRQRAARRPGKENGTPTSRAGQDCQSARKRLGQGGRKTAGRNWRSEAGCADHRQFRLPERQRTAQSAQRRGRNSRKAQEPRVFGDRQPRRQQDPDGTGGARIRQGDDRRRCRAAVLCRPRHAGFRRQLPDPCRRQARGRDRPRFRDDQPQHASRLHECRQAYLDRAARRLPRQSDVAPFRPFARLDPLGLHRPRTSPRQAPAPARS